MRLCGQGAAAASSCSGSRGGSGGGNMRKRSSSFTKASRSSHSSSNSEDEYYRMKEKLMARRSADGSGYKDRMHITEKDLDKDFARTSDPSPLDTVRAQVNRVMREKVCRASWWGQLVQRSVPVLGFVANYRREFLVDDIAAGLSVGIAAIPMGMSYAIIAGLNPEHGLYNDLFYCFIYMLLGTGRQIAVGVSAIEAMLTAEACARIVGWDAPYDEWLNCAMGLAVFVGFTLLLFRLLNAGVVARILADPVLSGFSTGSAVTIASSQLSAIFGISIPRQSTFFTWVEVLRRIDETQWRCVAIAASGVALLFLMRSLNRRYFRRFPFPGALLVLLIFIGLAYGLKIDQPPHNVKIVGHIPRGFPQPKMFDFRSTLVLPVFGQAVIYSVMFFVIHISIAKTLAQQNGYTLDANQEFFAMGVAGFVGSFFQCYPVATSVSRSSIANSTGAKTPLWNVANVAIMVLTVTVLTPVLAYMPLCALSSVIIFGVQHMMFFREGWRLLRLWSADFLLWVSCCFATIFWGAMEGVVVGVALSLLWLLKKNAFPVVAVLGRLPGTLIFRDVTRFPEAQEIPGVKIIRFDCSLNFCNAEEFEAAVVRLTGLAKNAADDMRRWNFSCFGKGGTLPKNEECGRSTNPNVSQNQSKHTTEQRGAMKDCREGEIAEVADENTDPRKLSIKSNEDGVTDMDKVEVSSASGASNVPPKVLIIDASSINDLDSTAIRMLENLAQRAAEANKILLFANWKGPMRDYLHRLRFYEVVPPEQCFLSIVDAVIWTQTFYLATAPAAPTVVSARGRPVEPGSCRYSSGASRYLVVDSPATSVYRQTNSAYGGGGAAGAGGAALGAAATASAAHAWDAAKSLTLPLPRRQPLRAGGRDVRVVTPMPEDGGVVGGMELPTQATYSSDVRPVTAHTLDLSRTPAHADYAESPLTTTAATAEMLMAFSGEEGPSFRCVVESAGSAERHFWAVTAARPP